jgi:hypothetical protein
MKRNFKLILRRRFSRVRYILIKSMARVLSPRRICSR